MIWNAVLLILVFGAGAALMSLEILGVRMMAPSFGDNTLIWSSVIGVFLAALSLGNICGGLIADRWPSSNTLAIILAAAATLFMCEPRIVDPVCSTIINYGTGSRIDPLIAAVTLFFLPTICMGAVTPLAIRLRIKSADKAGATAGMVVGTSTAGSIFGTLFTAFFLIEWYGVRTIVHLWGVALLVMAIIAAVGSKKMVKVAMLVMLCGVTGKAAAENKIRFRRDTLYHRIIVEDRDNTRVLRFDAGLQSKMSLIDSLKGQFEYVDFFHAALAINPHMRSVLFVGLGGGSGPRRFRHDYPDVSIDIVEIDPVVVDVAKKYFHFKEDEKMKVTVKDARVFLSRPTKRYDLIVLDAYASSKYGTHVPFHLATKEFFELTAKRLKPKGVLMYNVIGRTAGAGSKPVRAIYKTMRTVFPELCYFPAVSSPNVVLCGVRMDGDSLPKSLIPQGSKLVKTGRVILPQFLTRLRRYSRAPLGTTGVPVLTDDYAPIDNLLR